MSVLLPSTSAGPLPSPMLGLPPRRGNPVLRAWTVPATVVPFVTGEDTEGAAPSLGFLADLCEFAADLVTRGRVLPAISADGARAVWRPVLAGPDAEWSAALADRMPAACRAEQGRTGSTDGLPPPDALHAALDRLVDGLVRTRLAEARITLDAAPWLTALTSDDGALPAPTSAGGSPESATRTAARSGSAAGRSRTPDDPSVPERLGEVLEEWHAEAGRDAPVRLVLRLAHREPPEADEPDATSVHGVHVGRAVADDKEWLVEFFLQPLDEPSLLVSAADIWHDSRAPLRRWTHRPQERLIAGLGRAARLLDLLDEALRQPRPRELTLDTAGAHRFLAHAEVLQQAGFGVLLPAWWQEPLHLGLALDVRTAEPMAPVVRDDAADAATMVKYNWGLALGGRVLSEEELAELASVKVPLVRLRHRWVYLDAERLRAGLEFLRQNTGTTMSAADALRLVRLLPPEELPLPVTEVHGSGWVADLLSGRLGERLALIDQPPGLNGLLRPYQRRGFSWLVFMDGLGMGACLADDMGLGKTVQLLALLLHRRTGPTLLICPLSVLGNWQAEAGRFAPELRVATFHGSERDVVGSADVVLTTYATAARDADTLAAITWDRVVLDEAQHIKNSVTDVARAVRRFPARSRIALTGTPVENRLAELWSILDFLNPGLLGTAFTFRNRFAVPIERYADEDAAARLRHATRPFLLRRIKSDRNVIGDLPGKRHRRHLCGLTPEQASLYQAVIDDMRQRLKESRDKRRKGFVLSAMTKLKQVCDHPALLLGDGSPLPGRSGKLERLEEVVDLVLARGESALLFTQFARFGALLQPHLAARFGAPVRYLHGGTARGARDDMVAAFPNDDKPGLFLLSLKAGGTGLNLTAANHVVHIDRWWNPATETQATDRAYRIGQRRDVEVHTLLCLGTLEERIDSLIAGKGDLASRVVGTGESWLTTLSTDELVSLAELHDR